MEIQKRITYLGIFLGLEIEMEQILFICKCGKMEIWIEEKHITKPCPECKRKYKGVYKNNTIQAKEIK